MLTNIKNEYGIITYNEALVNQILAKAIEPWSEKARYIGDRQIRFGDDGLFIYAGISIRLGYSMNDIACSMINYIADCVENMLDLPLEDVVIEIIQMTTARSVVPRNIRFSLREEYDEEQGN